MEQSPISSAAAAGARTSNNSTHSPAPSSSSASLPHPWVAYVDASTAREYFFNPETNETTWNRPALGASSPWKQLVSKEHNDRLYWYNTETKETTWRNPFKERSKKKKKKKIDEDHALDQSLANESGVTNESFINHSHAEYNTEPREDVASKQDPKPRKTRKRKDLEDTAPLLPPSRIVQPRPVAEEQNLAETTGGKHNDSNLDEEDEEEGGVPIQVTHNMDESDDDFQARMMEQFPLLKKAFAQLEAGRRALEQERLEHEQRMNRELAAINAKLEELRLLTDRQAQVRERTPSPPPPIASPADPSAAAAAALDNDKRLSMSQKRTRLKSRDLSADLHRFSEDLERRSLSVVERRKSIRSSSIAERKSSATSSRSGKVSMADLKSIQDEANRLAAERGNEAATPETAAKQMASVSHLFDSSSATTISTEDDDEAKLQAEMDTVKAGVEYVMKEAAAQAEAQAMGRMETDYYAVLGVPQNASDADIKKAFRKRLIEWHPDKAKESDRELAVERTNAVQAAYKVCSDPWERQIYDWFGLEQYIVHRKVLDCFVLSLQTGMELIKHCRRGLPRTRVIWMDREMKYIMTNKVKIMDDEPAEAREKVKSISVASITDVVRGRKTGVLSRTGKKKFEDRYFSLISPERTLDFECASADACEFTSVRLKLLIIDLKKDEAWMYRHYEEQ